MNFLYLVLISLVIVRCDIPLKPRNNPLITEQDDVRIEKIFAKYPNGFSDYSKPKGLISPNNMKRDDVNDRVVVSVSAITFRAFDFIGPEEAYGMLNDVIIIKLLFLFVISFELL
jgi:hypothetical protein